ncbi:carbohydrate-binding module family 20 domain-containing protein [Glutamicibacter sp. JC586]|uniref:carbohydrate-binding module family 20 domain-containing protein n=1 Tax=Glutamicibacter sp. JC586 TaxID=2590552 RepID=UPI0013589280|nr:carbohydrate-binding module family 20 domain-containing protein [Glutamicibacter sp. JC586]
MGLFSTHAKLKRRRDRASAAKPGLALCASLALLAAPLFAAPAQGATPSNDGKDVILNLFQWNWKSVAQECKSSIAPAGFGYVQVSPPAEHLRGAAWWTSYQPVSYKVDSKLGNRDDFSAMVKSCNDAGVKVIADAVVNHMAGAGQSGTGTAGSAFSEDNFPEYSAQDFNDCRTNISNYSDRWQVQNCRLVGLQDLKTSSSYVQQNIADYLDDLVSLGVSGFRIDASKHIPATDLEAIKSKMKNPGVFWVHEVIGAAGEPIQESEYLGSGDSFEFDYARQLKSDFDSQIANLRFIGDGKLTSDRAGVFVANHDTERNGETMNYKWGAKYLLANVFMLSWPYGSPSVYSGYSFTDKDAGAPGASDASVPNASCDSSAWTCEQRQDEITGMVGFNNAVGDAAVSNWWDDGSNQIAFGRGNKGFVAINNTGSSTTREYSSSLAAGTYCDVVAGADCSQKITVGSDGKFNATVPAYGALALHVGALGDGSNGGGTDPSEEPVEEASDVSVAVTAETTVGQNIRIVGNQTKLGNWNPSQAPQLSAVGYPSWTGTVDLPAGTKFEYKYVKYDQSGKATWESGGNRSATVQSDGSLKLSDTWRN